MNLDDRIGEELTPSTHKTYGVARSEVANRSDDLSSRMGEELTPSSFSWSAPKAPKPEGGDFGRGFGVAWKQLKQTGYGAAGLAGAWVGNEAVRDWGLGGYESIGEEIAAGAARTDDVTNVASVGDAADWAQYGAGYLLGQAMQTIASGGIGSLVGKALAQKGVQTVLANRIKNDVAKRVAAGQAEDVARAAALGAASKYVGAAMGTASIYALNLVQEEGSIYGEAVQEARARGQSVDSVDLARVTGAGAGAAAIDTVVDVLGIGRLLKGTGTGNVFSRMVRGGLAQGALEASTEVVQTGIERWGAGREVFGEGSLGEYINAAALGALGGGVVGSVGGLRGKKATDTGVGNLPEADVSAVPGQNAQPESYEQQVERAYGVKLNLPSEEQQALRDLNAGLSPRAAPAAEFDPAAYWAGFTPVAEQAQTDPTGVSLNRAASAPPAGVAVSQMLKETEAALANLVTRPGIYDTIQQAGQALEDAGRARGANGEQAFMRRPDRNLGVPTPPPAEAPLPPGVAADPAAREAAIARMTRGLGAPEQGTLPLPPVANAAAPVANAAPASQPGVAQVAQVAQPAAATAAEPAFVAPPPTDQSVAIAPREQPQEQVPAKAVDDALVVPGTAYDGEPAEVRFYTDGKQITDARIRFADGTEIGIAVKKGDTFESVVARAESDGDFTRQEGFDIGQPKAQPKGAKQVSNREYTTRGESVDHAKRAEQEAAVAKLKADMKKARKKDRAKRALPADATTQQRQDWVNQQMAGDTGMKKSVTLVETPARWKLMTQVVEALFDQKVQFWSPVNAEINRLYEGFSMEGDPDTIYVSVNVQNPFAFVMGHEFGHNISRIRPQLWAAFLEELKPIIDKKEMQAFTHRLRKQYEQQAKNGGRRVGLAEIGAIAEDEVGGDAVGSAFMDPKFWRALEKAARPEAQPLIARMIAEIKAFIEDVMAMLKAAPVTRNSKMFTDTRALHRAVSEMLLDFGEMRENLTFKELEARAEQFYNEKMEPDSSEADWVELGKDLQGQFVELFDLYRQGDISWSELESDYLRIQQVWRSNSVTDELKNRLVKRYDEQQQAEARKYWDEKLHEPGEPKFDALTPEWQAYFVKQFRAWTDNQNVSLAEAYDKALAGLNVVRDQKKAELARQKKAAKSLEQQKGRIAAEVEEAEAARAKKAAENKAAAEAKAQARAEAIARAQQKALEKTLPKAAEALQNLTPAEKKRVALFYKAKSWTDDVAKAFTREVAKLINAGDNEALIDAVPDKLRPVIWRILRTISYSMKSRNPLDNPNFVRWFGDSKAVVTLTDAERAALEQNPEEMHGHERADYDKLAAKAAREGEPEVWYHGTSRDITTFQPKQANAIFVTRNPRFAEDFAYYSSEWAREHGVKSYAPSIYPLYVKAEKPFDFADKTHVEEVLAEVIDYWSQSPEIEAEARAFEESQDKVISAKIAALRYEINHGEWSSIESKEVQRAIKALGFDSFFVMEAGNKNLAVFQSSQLKSVYGNRGTYNDVADIRYSRKEVSREDLAGLTDEEIAFWTNKDGSLKEIAARFVEKLKLLTASVDEVAAVAWAGRAKRGWYMDSVKAIQHVFGQDGPRFAALLAAMSPQTSVEANLENALSVWANWVKAGRPTDRATILKIMGRSVQQADLPSKPKHALDKIAKHFGIPLHFSKEQMVEALTALSRKSTANRDTIRQMAVLEAWENNTVRALTEDDTTLSGPKVNSFYRNLIGDLMEVTNDAWMASFFAIDKKLLGGALTKGGNPGKGPRYLALSARVRQAAQRLSELTGEVWTPAEVQETIWAWAKTLYELQEVKGETRNAVQLLNDGELTDELIAATPDFRSLFYDDAKPYKRLLADAGLADRLGERGGIPAVPPRRRGGAKRGAKAEARPFAEVAQERHERAAAQRLADRAAGVAPIKFSRKDDDARGVNVEVAPNPDDVAVAQAFDALPEEEKKQATYEVANAVIPAVLNDMGLTGVVEHTIGGFEGASNPSIIVKFPKSVPFDTMTEAGKVIGSILQQKAIISYDESDSSGTQTGFVKVVPERGLSYDEEKALFAQVYAAMPEAAGFTGRDGAMVFGNFTGFSDNPLTDAEFHEKMKAALAGIDFPVAVETVLFRFRSEWIEPVTLEGTRYEGDKQAAETRGDGVRGQGRIGALQEQAQAILSRYASGEAGATPAQGRVAYSRKDASPVIEVYGLAGDKVAGLASYDPLTKVWSVWNAPAGQDIRDVQINPVQVANTTDALDALRRPGVRLVRRRASPFNEGGNQPSDFSLTVENQNEGGGNAFTWAVDSLVNAANALLATNMSGPQARQAFIRMAQDAYIDVKVVQDNIRRKGGVITGANDLYQAITLYPGRTGAQMQEFERKFAEPMEEAIEAALKKGASVESIEEWLMARHAEERNAVIRQRTLGQNDAGSGITDADARAILAQRQPWQQELDAIGALADGISQFKLALMKSSGLIDQQTHDALSNYQHYVPLKGLDEDDTGELTSNFGVGTGTGFSGKGSLLQYATGRGSRANHVISHLLLDAEAKIVRAGKNEVAQSLLKLAEDFPDPNFWRVNEVKSRPVFDPDRGTIKLQSDPDFLNPNVIVAYVDGKPSKVEINDLDFARAMTNAGAAGNNSVLEFMRRMNGWWSQMVTTYNPVWTLVNGMRDAQTAFFNIKADPNLPPDMGAKVMKNIAAMNPRAGIFELMRDPNAQNEWARLYRELESKGGITHFFGVRTIEDRARKMAEMENRVAKRGLPAKAQDAWRKARGPEFAKLLQDVGATIEAVPRVAAYKALIESGWTKADAADYAKNLTVNFNRKGTQKFLSAGYMFFNPAVQGTARLWQALKTDEGKAIAGGLMALGFIAGLTGNSAGDDDENGIPDYQQMSSWERSTNFIPWPNGPKVPLPYGWNAFYAAGNYLSDLFHGRGLGHVLWNQMKAAADAFDPVGGSDSKDAVNWLVKAASPTIVDPLVQYALNDNAFGTSILPPAGSRTFRPDSESGKQSVGWAWREGARAVNRMTGGSATKAGAIDVNPNTLEHFFAGYLPGWPQEFVKTLSTTAKMGRGEEMEAREVPVVRKFWSQPQKTSYDDLAEVKGKVAELTAMSKGDAEDRKELTSRYPGWAGLKVQFDIEQKKVTDFYKRKAQITDGKLKVADPAAEQKRLDNEIAKSNNRLLKAYREKLAAWER